MTTTIVQTSTEVYCTLQIPGIHNWNNCPFEEVAYLRDDHRHMFHIKAHKIVTHTDRDVEFIMLKNRIQNFLVEKYYRIAEQMCYFGAMSCEMIAHELCSEFDLCMCEVNEDGENGAIVHIKTVLG